MSTSEAERTAFAALTRHTETCPQCRAGADGCPEAAALYRAWRPTLNLAPREEQ
ncbi:hypothetical protein [Streptomyces sp. NPDC088923]|uniref:hypothetical protein n=1 Tax=Streptomyces sp. NPDC088923 TaxID=3365913 RepID=UPI0037F60B65